MNGLIISLYKPECIQGGGLKPLKIKTACSFKNKLPLWLSLGSHNTITSCSSGFCQEKAAGGGRVLSVSVLAVEGRLIGANSTSSYHGGKEGNAEDGSMER